jgi:protein-disulfide isomerase
MQLRPFVLFVVLAVAVVLGALMVPATLPTATKTELSAFERRVHAYLMSHPEVILDSVEALRRRSEAAKAIEQRQAVAALQGRLADPGPLPVAGNPAGDVTVVEFFDYRCPYCRRVVPEVKALLAADGKVRFVFKEYPVLGPDSVVAARAAVASARQGKYLQMHDALMTHENGLNEAAVMEIARGLGLDLARLRADMAAPETTGLLQDTIALGRRAGVDGTPAFIIGREVVPGYTSAANLRAAVERARRGR